MTLHNFRKKLALALIDNEYIKESNLQSKRLKRTTLAEHNLVTAPRLATKFTRGKWQKTGKAPYQQYLCRGRGCKKKFVHAVNVGWGTGYAKNVMVDTLWT